MLIIKLITFNLGGKSRPGIICKSNTVFDLSQLGFCDMNDFIIKSNGSIPDEIKELTNREAEINADSVKLEAPIPEPRQDIICLGINYAEHAEESARFKKETYTKEASYPVYFSKRVNRALAHGETLPDYSYADSQIDYEAELAVILGKDARNVKADEVEDFILGYTVMNDVSARVHQENYNQWYFGKSFDSFAPMGPWIVTKDEIDFEPALDIKSYVNGEMRQSSNTSKLIFGISHIITELSSVMTLKAGTIISTGTPSGVGLGFNPPKFLKSGDTVECVIEKIGTLKTVIG